MNSYIRKIRKFSLIWDFEKEEDWLNEMSQNGWSLASVGLGTYSFIKADPGEYTIRLHMHSKDDEYLDIMRGSGAEYIGRIGSWVYFKRRAELESFDVFSDLDSKLEHLGSISRFLMIAGGVNLYLGVMNSLGQASRIAWINLVAACFLMYGLGRIHGKAEELKKQRLLHE